MLRVTLLAIIVSCQGCAAYTIASAGTYVATGKTLTDHGSSTLAQADCNAVHVIKDKYYCEQRNAATTFNRNGY